jgi:glyoxylase-like metal-dependent hydrolase (beta-lactamase superfamily II)
MKRELVLGALVITGVLSIGVAAQRGGAEGPRVVEIDKISDTLYVGKGGGGNTAIFLTANGTVLVDTKNPGWGQPLLDAIKKVSNRPITTIVNTHTHGDHTSGQLEFPGTFEVVAHENTRASMMKTPAYQKPANASALPKRTFTDRLTLGSGNDRVELYYFGPGHTNGDAWVVFPSQRVLHAGDIFAGKQVPLVDMGNGGSGVAYPDTLMKAYNGITGVDTIITGHSNATVRWADLKEYADFNRDFLTWVQAQMKAGRSPEQAAAEYKVPERYKGYTANLPPFFGGMVGYVKGMYGELQKR